MSEEKKGFFARLKEGLTKTRDNIVRGIDSVFSGFSAIDDDFYEEIEEILIMGDLGVDATEKILTDMKQKVKELHLKEPHECKEVLIDSIRRQMDLGENAYEFAGMIILADRIENEEKTHIGTMDITVRRNAYGRQLGSFYAEEDFDNVGKVPMTFIRAPYITKCGPKARAIATCKGNIVAAVQDNQMVTSFHPELNDILLVHKYFVEEICK